MKKGLREKLTKLGILVVYLFGSKAIGKGLQLSDVYIGVVCKDPIQDMDTRSLYNRLYEEALAKLLKATGNRHSGQAKRDPESRIFKRFWIPAFAGMTQQVIFARTSELFLDLLVLLR